MRVQFAQNIVHGNIHDAIGVHIVHILIVDIIDKPVELVLFGIGGEKVKTEKQLTECINKILNDEKSYVVNTIIDKSNFREGSISV